MLNEIMGRMSRGLLSAEKISPIAAGRSSRWAERACLSDIRGSVPAPVPGDAAALEATRRAALRRLNACLFTDTAECARQIHTLLCAASWSDVSARDPYAADPCAFDEAFCETACDLAAALNLLRAPLKKISPALPERIEAELRRRVLTPLAGIDALPPLSLRSCCMLLCAAILGGSGESLRWPLIQQLCQAIDRHLNRLPADGSMPGGPEDAAEAAIALMDAAEVILAATNGRVDITKQPRIACIADHILFSHINDGWFINPGERDMQPAFDAESLFRFGQRAGDGAMCDTAAWLLHNCTTRPAERALTRALNRNTTDALAECPPRLRLFRNGMLPDAGLMFMRGFSLHITMTGGTGTTHADAGNICLMYKDQPILIDLGGDACATDMHSLPTIDGMGQLPDTPPRATECSSSGGDATCYSVSLTGAYPENCPVSDHQRTLLMGSPGHPCIRLMDMLQLTRPAEVQFHFICAREPQIEQSSAVIGPVRLKWSGELTAAVAPVKNAYRLTLISPESAVHQQVIEIAAR